MQRVMQPHSVECILQRIADATRITVRGEDRFAEGVCDFVKTKWRGDSRDSCVWHLRLTMTGRTRRMSPNEGVVRDLTSDRKTPEVLVNRSALASHLP